MNILLCNDDGIAAPGLAALAEKLSRLGKIFVAAPDSERSAASNSLTLAHPLRVKEVDFPAAVEKAWSISGTPTDCAKIALSNLLPARPDLVVSGINRGPNMCVDVFYSGTVAAAFEGAFKGITSVAVSLDNFKSDACYDRAATWAEICIKNIVKNMLSSGRLFNINVPGPDTETIKGIKITRTGKVDYKENYEHRLDPNGRSYYWIRGNPEVVDKDENTDVVAVKSGFVSVTPLRPELTDFNWLEKLQNDSAFNPE